MRLFTLIAALLAVLPLQAARPRPLSDEAVRTAMKSATTFMVEQVSNHGGYLWNYAPDFSRVRGELECKPTMMWIERGTPAMGNIFLDAYHATGDEYYFQAAEQAAAALVWSQLSCGGWNYMADFAGEASLKDWYERVAAGYQYCAQEHLHYSGNATFDDGTINDGVHTGNIRFLLDCWRILGEERVLEPIRRAMHCVLVLQGGKPLYLHRGDGKYWVDYDPHNLITHYRSYRTINIGPRRKRYEALLETSVEEATKDSPFRADAAPFSYPAQYSRGSGIPEREESIRALVEALSTDKPWWPGGLLGVSHENPGFSDAPLPAECISTWTYMQNMTRLINYLMKTEI